MFVLLVSYDALQSGIGVLLENRHYWSPTWKFNCYKLSLFVFLQGWNDVWWNFNSLKNNVLYDPQRYSPYEVLGFKINWHVTPVCFIGQAFVGLESLELAREALEAVHGYVLHGRPVFVQFARGAIAKPDPKSLITSDD